MTAGERMAERYGAPRHSAADVAIGFGAAALVYVTPLLGLGLVAVVPTLGQPYGGSSIVFAGFAILLGVLYALPA
jgi:hypothetical protein